MRASLSAPSGLLPVLSALGLAMALSAVARSASAAEDARWYLEGFGEIALGTMEEPGDRYDVFGLDGGFGADAAFVMLPWLHLSGGPRFSTMLGDAQWGRYYTLTIPVALRFAVPLSRRGHELQLGGGLGPGWQWKTLKFDSYNDTAGTHSAGAMAYELFLGYHGPRDRGRLAFLWQGGVRLEDAADELMDFTRLVFLRFGVAIR